MLIRIAQILIFSVCLIASAQTEEDVFLDKEDSTIHLAGPLTASLDDFSRTIAFDFSQAFFRRRSLGADQRTVLLNGVVMNKMDDGRAHWANWGGLNDALRDQQREQGLAPSSFHGGKLGGILNMNSFAGQYSNGLKVSLAAANRSYTSRLMVTYVSPWSRRDWKLNASASSRFAEEGYRNGTPYRAFSFLVSLDRKFKKNHYFNSTLILAQNLQGMSGAMTREVYELKGNRYNSFWGFQEGKKRSARLKRSFEPILQLNYSWLKNPDIRFGAHLTVQHGISGRSRMDYGGSRQMGENGSVVGGGTNPDPTYYQKLPSYFLRSETSPDYAGAFISGQNLIEEGQIDWAELYHSNASTVDPGNSVYVLYEDRQDDTQFGVQFDFNTLLNRRFRLSGSLSGRFLESSRYALVMDLLGGGGYLDVDPFDTGTEEAQSDLRNPNQIVKEGERFKYDYQIRSKGLMSYLRMDYKSKKHEFFVAAEFEARSYERYGRFENGSYPGRASFGKGPALTFATLNLKAGMTYKFNGRHLIQLFSAMLQEPPAIRDSYSNIRESHESVVGLGSVSSLAFEMNYQVRMPKWRGRLGAYLIQSEGGNRISFYYADGLTGLENSGTSSFVHEILTGIGHTYMGTEISLGYFIAEGLEVTGVASLGRAEHGNNPSLYVTSDELKNPVVYGSSFLKGYRVANGPQTAVSFGFRYSDPDFWWVGATANWFGNSFVSVAPVTRTRNFMTDPDGGLNSAYDESIARELLKQEELPSFGLLNLTGGKSWKVKDNYLGVFCSINNALNVVYKSGGYEQSRNANYESLLQDKSREFPLFSPKYWFGYGATFFTSFYIRIK